MSSVPPEPSDPFRHFALRPFRRSAPSGSSSPSSSGVTSGSSSGRHLVKVLTVRRARTSDVPAVRQPARLLCARPHPVGQAHGHALRGHPGVLGRGTRRGRRGGRMRRAARDVGGPRRSAHPRGAARTCKAKASGTWCWASCCRPRAGWECAEFSVSPSKWTSSPSTASWRSARRRSTGMSTASSFVPMTRASPSSSDLERVKPNTLGQQSHASCICDRVCPNRALLKAFTPKQSAGSHSPGV